MQTRFQKPELKNQSSELVTFEVDGTPLAVSSPTPGVFRLKFGKSRQPDYGLLVPQESAETITVEPLLDGKPGDVVLKTFFTELTITSKPFSLRLTHRMRPRVTLPSFGFDAKSGTWIVGLGLADGEAVYGLGEQFLALNRRGQTVSPDESLAYQVPLAWSPRGWGVCPVTPAAVHHDVGASDEALYEVQVHDECLDMLLFGGTPTEVLNAYTNMTGKPSVPPVWSVGVWVSNSVYGNAQEAVELAQKLRAEGIGCDVIAIDGHAAWKVQTRSAFEWDRSFFNDPVRTLAALKALNMHVSIQEQPTVPLDAPQFDEFLSREMLLTTPDGQPVRVKAADGSDAALLDFTQQDAYTFWREKHESLFKDGVGVIDTGFIHGSVREAQAYNGDTGERLQSAIPFLRNRCVFEASQKFVGEGIDKRATICAHIGAIGSQRYPLIWSRHKAQGSHWDQLREHLRGALNAGMSGLPFSAIDVGGATPDAAMPAETYVRWLAASVFFSHVRFPAVDKIGPTSFGDETTALIKRWLKFRYRLVPYVMGALEEAARNGLPAMRAMPLAFPDDAEAHRWPDQYLFGPALLVAPILSDSGKSVVYFPRGEKWHDLATGVRYDGGTVYEFEKPLDGLPVFGREGHILCLGPEAQATHEINSIRPVTEAWLFGLPAVDPCVTAIKVKVMQMQGNAYIKGLEGTKVLAAYGYEVSRRGAEVKVVKKR